LDHVYKRADMHVRQQRAPVSFTQRKRFTKRTTRAL